MPTLDQRDGVHVVDLGSDENRFGPNWVDAVDGLLDRVEADPAPLVTMGTGRYYSDGLDLEWIMAHPDELPAFLERVHGLFARVLTLGVPTVAAVNGHAFGAGSMFAMAHDWRVMRSDRGWFCFPEVDINIPFTPGMAALIQAKLTPRAAVDSMTTGRRFGGVDARAAGLVDDTAPEDELQAAAIARVAGLAGKDPATLAAIKNGMYAHVVDRLGTPSPPPV